MSPKLTGARFIAETFKGYGLTHVFFVEAILRLSLIEMEALGIRRVLTHGEKAAAYMADGYSKTSRKPGICMAQSVGAANLAAGLQDAFLGLSPVIALTGRKHSLAQYRHAYQEILHAPMFNPVTKYNVTVETIDQLPYLLRQAFREVTSGAPGPAHLDLMGHQGQIIEESEADIRVVVEKPFVQCPSIRPNPDPNCVQEAARLLVKARKPVIIAGGGTKLSSAGAAVVKLAEKLSIPVATSLNGKGAIPENHPLSLGIVGRYSRWCANRIVSEADLVLYIGSRTGDLVTNAWSVPQPYTPVIQIDIDPAELGRNYPNQVGVMGDAKVTLAKLIKSVQPKPSLSKWAQHAQKTVRKWRDDMELFRTSNARPIRVERLCKDLTEVLPSNAILVADTGFAGIWTGTMVDLTGPNQSYVRCAGSLGWGFPASLGAKCAAPERPVVCFTGDGGFWYHISELETAKRCGINTVIIVNNNSGLGQCLMPIKKLYGNRSGNREEMCLFSKIDFSKIAQDMGCLGIRVEDPSDISGALRKALSAGAPVVIDVVTDVECRAPDAWGGRDPV